MNCPTCGCQMSQEYGPCAGKDLLEALKAFIDGTGEPHERVIAAKAAIAKAEGK